MSQFGPQQSLGLHSPSHRPRNPALKAALWWCAGLVVGVGATLALVRVARQPTGRYTMVVEASDGVFGRFNTVTGVWDVCGANHRGDSTAHRIVCSRISPDSIEHVTDSLRTAPDLTPEQFRSPPGGQDDCLRAYPLDPDVAALCKTLTDTTRPAVKPHP